MSTTLEQARDAAQTDAVIDAAAALVEVAGSYTAALLALCGDAGGRGGDEQARAIEACAGTVAQIEVPCQPPSPTPTPSPPPSPP